MKYNVGDKLYCSVANGQFCTFAYTEIIELLANNYYKSKILKVFGCVWEDSDKILGHITISKDDGLFETFEECKKKLYKEMRFEYDHDFIRFYFEGNT